MILRQSVWDSRTIRLPQKNMQPLLIALTLAATLSPASPAAGREEPRSRKAKAPACEVSKCCLHSRAARQPKGVRIKAPKPAPTPEQTWQEKMASKGSGG